VGVDSGTDALDLSLTLASAAHGRDDPVLAAQDVLAELCAHEPITAAALTCRDPITGSHRALSTVGYPGWVLDYLRSPAFLVGDLGYRLLVSDPSTRARSWRDVPCDYTVTPSVTQVFGPAGYAGGATARLTTRDGRYVGDLHVSTTDAALPSATVLGALHHAAPLLAAAVDVTRRLRLGLLGLEPAGDGAAAVVTESGTVHPLTEPTDAERLLHDHELLARVLRWYRDPARSREGWFRYPSGAAWWRVRLVRLDQAILVITEPDRPGQPLSRRELEVLTLLVEGLPNVAIAHRLDISARTVAHHVEHILVKLDVSCRASAVRRAIEDGLRLLPRGAGPAGAGASPRLPGRDDRAERADRIGWPAAR
jgi:DNA-binding CsgD family transcriptional regulator